MTRFASILLALVCVAPAADASEDGWRLDLGAGVGAWLLDADLDDYRWQTTPSTVVRKGACSSKETSQSAGQAGRR